MGRGLGIRGEGAYPSGSHQRSVKPVCRVFVFGACRAAIERGCRSVWWLHPGAPEVPGRFGSRGRLRAGGRRSGERGHPGRLLKRTRRGGRGLGPFPFLKEIWGAGNTHCQGHFRPAPGCLRAKAQDGSTLRRRAAGRACCRFTRFEMLGQRIIDGGRQHGDAVPVTLAGARGDLVPREDPPPSPRDVRTRAGGGRHHRAGWP